MLDDVVMNVDHVSKRYCKSLKRSMLYGIHDISRNMIGLSSHSNKLRSREFWALDDISFNVKKGDTLGIIGPNGAGKTTMLKLLNGIFWPDKGKITTKGRIGALIAVGAGFHPLLTGRENIYVNGAILGMSKKEINKKFDDIISFADIGDFLDTPVNYYSSGMFVRLGFAVAIHCNPDILLVDEILSVGDINFQKKCLDRIIEFKEQNVTIIFISHNLLQVEYACKKCIFLTKGKINAYGNTQDVIARFVDYMNAGLVSESVVGAGTGQVTVMGMELCDVYGNRRNYFYPKEDFKIVIKYLARERVKKPNFVITLNYSNSIRIFSLNTKVENTSPEYIEGEGIAECLVKDLQLLPNTYNLDVFVKDDRHGVFMDSRKNIVNLVIKIPTNSDRQYRVSGDMGIIPVNSEWKYY